MKVLITAATQYEIGLFDPPAIEHDILITGVGSVATLYHLQKRIHQVDYDLIIQAGFAGTFSNNLNLGQTVIVTHDTFGDLGAEEDDQYQTLFDMGLADKNEFPFTNGWLVNNNGIIDASACKKVTAITVNKVSDAALLKQQRSNTFNADVETMEGAAFHYICLQENVPFVQIRTITNVVGVRNKTKWLLNESIENLATALTNFVNNLKG